MSSPLDRVISTDASNPDCYMFKCGLCEKKVFSHLLRLVKQIQAEHKTETGHDISFIRGKLIRPGSSQRP